MALQLSVAVRNARLDAIESQIGPSAVLKIRTGAPPANCAAADTGTVLATMNLPADWMAAASAGTKGMLGVWQDASADAAGTTGHFRIYAAGGAVCGMQGTVAVSGGDMDIDNALIAAAQQVNVTGFVVADANS